MYKRQETQKIETNAQQIQKWESLEKKKKKQTMTVMFKELEAIENSTKNLQIIKKESIAEKRLKF